MNWYSTCIRRFCLIEGTGAVIYEDSVLLLKASDWDEAQRKAIALGLSKEELYENSEGLRVRWAFDSVITLDEIRAIADGVEVYSQLAEYEGASISFDHTFSPENSNPTQSM
jgi:hypothetical protein